MLFFSSPAQAEYGNFGGYSNFGGYDKDGGYDAPEGFKDPGTGYQGKLGNTGGGATGAGGKTIKADTAGQVFCNAFYGAGVIPNFISIIAYLAGMAIFIRGAFDLVKRSSDPNTPLHRGLLGLAVGAFVVTLPFLVQFLHNSIYGTSISGHYSMPTCSATPGVTPGDPVGLDVMLTNFVNNIKGPIMGLISVLCMVLGAAMIFWNMVRLSKFGTDARTSSVTAILSGLVIGAMLMAVGQTLDVSLATLFGTDVKQGSLAHYTSLAYVPGGSFNMDKFNNAMTAVFTFLYIIGAISFVRGFMVLRNAVEGTAQATKGQAFTHIIGGTILVNMPGFIHIIEKTVGVQILNS